MIETLIQEYQLAKEKVNELYNQLSNTSDGFVYLTKTRCYGSISWDTYINRFTAQELCNEYYGDNGIVDVYTNNPDHNISTCGDVEVMSLDDISKISQDRISRTAGMLKLMSL